MKTIHSTKSRHLFTLFFLLTLIAGVGNTASIPTISFSYQEQKIPALLDDNGNETSTIELTVAEKRKQIFITATLSEPQTHEVSFTFNHALGTATVFRDIAFPESITGENDGRTRGAVISIAKGETQKAFPIVEVLNDFFDEKDETAFFSLGNAKGAELSHSTIKMIILDDDEPPRISLTAPGITRNPDGSYNATINENDGGLPLKLTVLDTLSSFEIEVEYEIIQDTGINPNGELDYRDPGEGTPPFTSGRLIIIAEALEKDFSFLIDDDISQENQETLTFRLTTANNASIHSTRNTLTLTINDDDANAGAINDTGVTSCYDDEKTVIDCGNSNSGFPGIDQDGSQITPNQFVKLDEEGNIINNSDDAVCIYDENTHLVWQADDKSYQFSWLNKINSINGGDEGFEGSAGTNENKCDGKILCNTDNNKTTLNTLTSETSEAIGLCNIQNWRTPKLRELLSIMHFEPNNDDAFIDTQYFKIYPGFLYWTSNPAAVSSAYAWCIYFGKKIPETNPIRQCEKTKKLLLRMVANCRPDPDNNDPNRPC